MTNKMKNAVNRTLVLLWSNLEGSLHTGGGSTPPRCVRGSATTPSSRAATNASCRTKEIGPGKDGELEAVAVALDETATVELEV